VVPRVAGIRPCRTGCAFWVIYFVAIDERVNSSPYSAAKNSTVVPFADAARFFGVDLFTFYALVQRTEIPTFLAPCEQIENS
jgi:hypothetical protein